MIRRMLWPALFGLLGTGVLVALGIWQLSRAEEKAALVAAMEARIFEAPRPLPDSPDPGDDRYMPVRLDGRFLPEHVFVMAAQRGQGPGFHLVSGFETAEGRRVMVERGFLPEAARARLPPETGEPVALLGNLHWPQDADRFTPDYDAGRNLVFARDVRQMAELLGTEETLIVLRDSTESVIPAQPVPVNEVSIPDNHLGYAVQWFLMALAWAGMTLFLLWRIRTRRE